MPTSSKCGAWPVAAIGLALCVAVSFKANAGGGKPHQNLGVPQQCATLLSGTPAYRDCMDYAKGGSQMKTVNTDTQLKAQPIASAPAVGILNKGTQVALIERTADGFWCHVRSGGFTGYVPFEALN
jgi:hypothetical protein